MPQSVSLSQNAPSVSMPLKLVSQAPAEISMEEQAHALRLVHQDSYYSQTTTTLTTGIFLVGLALQFKASNATIGLLSAIPFLAQLLQLPAIHLLSKSSSRRTICVATTLFSRLWLIPILGTPWLASSTLALFILLLAFICHTGTGAISTCAWNAWLKDLLPMDKLGTFFSRKLASATLTSIILTLLGGCFIDFWFHHFPHFKTQGYSLIFGLALLVGLLGVPPLRRIPEQQPIKHTQTSWGGLLKSPLQNSNFRQLILFMAGWNFAVNLAAPFFTVYMLTMLGYSMVLVTGLTIASQVANLLFIQIWGRLTDRFSNKSVLSVAAPMYIGCILGWTFIPFHGSLQATLPAALVLHLLLGIASAGVTLASGNIAMKLAPAGRSVEFLAVNSMASSVAAGLAPILGGLFADYFSHQELALVLQWHNSAGSLHLKTLDFQYWDFFFAIAFLLGVLSLTKLARIQEPGGARKKVILREFITESGHSLNALSQTRHIKSIVSFPAGLIRSSRIWLENRD